MMGVLGDKLIAFARANPSVVRPIRRPLLALYHRSHRREQQLIADLFTTLSELLVEDVCVKVEEFGGHFYLDPRSAVLRRIVVDGSYEPQLTRLCGQYVDPGRDVLDVGANVGFHAVFFASLLTDRKVLAVEPTSRALARLKRNLQANGVADRVLVQHGAISDQESEIEIKTILGKEEFSSMGQIHHPAAQGEAVQVENVRAQTLDSLVAEHKLNPGFVKVDVEGFEHAVIRGADQVLAKHRPAIIAELSDPLLRANGSSAAAVVDMITAYDYEVIDPLRPAIKPGTREYGDILCVPR